MTGTLPDGRSASRILGDTAYLLEVSEEADRRIGRALELLSVVVPFERCVLFEARPGRPQRLVVVPDISREERGILAARAVRLLALLADHHERGLPPEQHAAPGSGGARLAVPLVCLDLVIGVLLVERASAYDEQHLSVLAVVAAELAAYLTTLALCEEETGRLAELTRAVGPADLATVVREAVEDAEPDAEAKRLGLQLMTIGRGEFLVRGDPARLRQVVTNLLGNAIKFTPEGGRIDVCLEALESETRLTVCDTGPGIPADFLPRIFHRFEQVSLSPGGTHRGLGLGLAIAREIVELHGGTIVAGSGDDGHGAIFTVRFPLGSIATAGRDQSEEESGQGRP